MRRQNETPGAGNVGGGHGRANASNRQSQYSTGQRQGQEIHAPSGDMPAYVRNGMIYVAGRHLCSVRGGELRRTFDSSKELLRGSLLFRLDVLAVAVDAGARVIVATDRASGKRWRVSLQEVMARGWVYDHARFGQQVGLPLTSWQAIHSDGGTPEPELVQLDMFGGGR